MSGVEHKDFISVIVTTSFPRPDNMDIMKIVQVLVHFLLEF